MSLITDDPEHSPRDCSRSTRKHHRQHRHRRALIAASSTVASLLALALILWLTLRPSSPRFSLLAATATVGNASATVVVDAALTAHNPNAHATALYDQLRASASYGGVPLGTGAPPFQPVEQQADDQGDVVFVISPMQLTSPSPSGRSAPGVRALLRVRVEGQLRWKVTAWVSGRHGLTVECVAAVVLSSSSAGQQQQLQGSGSECATHVL